MTERLPLDESAIVRYRSPDGELICRVEVSRDTKGERVYAAGFETLSGIVHPDQLRRRGEPIEVLLAVIEELGAGKLINLEQHWSVPNSPGEAGLGRSRLLIWTLSCP